jgi:hypothetical protein
MELQKPCQVVLEEYFKGKEVPFLFFYRIAVHVSSTGIFPSVLNRET